MIGLGSLARRLGEATDVPSAAEVLAEHVSDALPGSAVRIYTLAPGDRCSTCTRARDCLPRDRCLHLAATLGSFALPPGHVERVPRTAEGWGDAVERRSGDDAPGTPPELAAPAGEGAGEQALLLPLESGGEVVGVLGVRSREAAAEAGGALSPAAFLAASAFRSLESRRAQDERLRQLLLVNEVGRKVNAILNDEMLLRQAVVDVQQAFGFHNVMVFMREAGSERLVLRAQGALHAAPSRVETRVAPGEGIVGRALKNRRTELVGDVSADPDFLGWFTDTRSEIAVPIQIGGVVEGVLNVESDRLHAFAPSDRLVLETIANQLAIALENARLFAMVREREHRYRVLVESNPGAVFHLDPQGRVTFANPAAEALTRDPDDDEPAARPATLPELAVPEDRAHVEKAVARALAGESTHDLEFHVARPDAAPRTIHAALQPLGNDHGDIRGVVVLARDQSRERELQEQVRQSEKLSAIGSLVSGVAHELNNPLAGILGFAQLLLSRPMEEWKRQEVEKIENNARRAQHIVENLLAFARQARLKKRPSSINDIIDSVIRLNEYQLRMDNVVIQRDLDLRIPLVPLDVNRWQQVFINLADNAHQAMVSVREGDRVLRFETRRRPQEIEVRVSDTGPGVPSDVRRRIFEPFFTTKDSGTGLGLGICFGIVTEHGGRIELDPEHGRGACFRIRLPIPADAEEPEQAPPADDAAANQVGLGKRALVVDDEAHVCEVISETLMRYGYEVDTVADAARALERVSSRDYDVVLSDIFMPGEMNGVELFRRLLGTHPQLAERVVLLTGNLLNEEILDEIADRSVRCIEKPFDIHALARLVNEVAQGSPPAGAAGAGT